MYESIDLHAQPFMQGYKSIYFTPSFAGSLGKGRIQHVVQSNEPSRGLYRHRYMFISIDDVSAKLKGGWGIHYELSDYREQADSMHKGPHEGLTDLFKDKLSFSYSPKLRLGAKTIISPGIRLSHERLRLTNDSPGNKFNTGNLNQFFVEGGILVNSARSFSSLSFYRHLGRGGITAAPRDSLPTSLYRFRWITGHSFDNFLDKKLAFKPVLNLDLGRSDYRDYFAFNTMINLNFEYDKKLLFGLLYVNEGVMPSIGYKHDRFRINLTTSRLLPSTRSYAATHANELAFEYYFHTRNKQAKVFKAGKKKNQNLMNRKLALEFGLQQFFISSQLTDKLKNNGSELDYTGKVALIPAVHYQQDIGARSFVHASIAWDKQKFNSTMVYMNYVHNYGYDYLLYYRARKYYEWESLQLALGGGVYLYQTENLKLSISVSGFMDFNIKQQERVDVAYYVREYYEENDGQFQLDYRIEQNRYTTTSSIDKDKISKKIMPGFQYGFRLTPYITENIAFILDYKMKQHIGDNLMFINEKGNIISTRKINHYFGTGIQYDF